MGWKRHFALLSLLGACLLAPPGSAGSETEPDDPRASAPRAGLTVSATGLHAGPDSRSEVLSHLEADTHVGVTLASKRRENRGGVLSKWYRVVTADGRRGWIFGNELFIGASSAPVDLFHPPGGRTLDVTPCGAPMERELLPRLLEERGFVPPPHFKGLVVAIDPADDGALTCRAHDYGGTSTDRSDWWPASTVKLYAAIAALEKMHAMGFSPGARVTFHYDNRTVTQQLERMVRLAIVPSNNVAFDRLAEIVGFDELNTGFFVPEKGFRRTVLMRGYSGRFRDEVTGRGTLRDSPAITIIEGDRVAKLPARAGTGDYPCPDQGNCTTLVELAEALRRVMLHEHLPEHERFALGEAHLAVLRSALHFEKERGPGVVDGIRAGFGPRRPVNIYRKAGYAARWYSDNAFIEEQGTERRWIVTAAGFSGREALRDASHRIGALLASGALRAPTPTGPAPGVPRPPR